MAFTLYDATIVHMKLSLKTLDNILTKAEALPNSDKFPQARICEDMKPLTFQIHAATRFSDRVLARLSDRQFTPFEDNLVTYADMHARIAKVIGDLEQADKEVVNRLGEEVALTDLPSFGEMELSGKAFAMGAAIPNINFHVTMAYAILRKEGVPLGKGDYIMPFAGELIMKKQ